MTTNLKRTLIGESIALFFFFLLLVFPLPVSAVTQTGMKFPTRAACIAEAGASGAICQNCRSDVDNPGGIVCDLTSVVNEAPPAPVNVGGGEPAAPKLSSDTFQPLGNLGPDAPQKIIGSIISYILGLVGVIALVMFIYGGILWMTAAGSQERITKAKQTLIWASLGLIAIFAAYQAVDLVLKGLGV